MIIVYMVFCVAMAIALIVVANQRDQAQGRASGLEADRNYWRYVARKLEEELWQK